MLGEIKADKAVAAMLRVHWMSLHIDSVLGGQEDEARLFDRLAVKMMNMTLLI